MTTAILAIDQGTTNSKAVLVSTAGEILSRGSSPVGIEHPQPGWVEQSPLRIWASVQEAIAACLAQVPTVQILGIAISNQRESVTIWDADDGQPLGPVVSWQCRRSAPACAELIAAGHEPRVRALTGLPIDPMFPGPKMKWLLDRAPAGHRVRLGTIDAWLIHCLTDGQVHACDAANAARSQLLDLNRMEWSDELCALFGIPKAALPELRDSAARFGETRGVAGLPDGIPICAAIGDSHAALFGHRAFHSGDGKVTFGTGSSIMMALQGFIAPQQGITTTINGETVLSTGINGFGIRIQDASSHAPVALAGNNWLPFNVNSRPGFEAVPVKQSGTQLTASEFSATMTMVVEYQ